MCWHRSAAALDSQDPNRAHERWVRLPGVPHPVAPQARHEQGARVHLHRQTTDPVAEGEDPYTDTQDITAAPRVRADQTEPGHARMGQLLPARRGETHLQHAGHLRLAVIDQHAHATAPLELDGHPQTVHPADRPVATDQRGRDRTAPHSGDPRDSLPLARHRDPQPLSCSRKRLTTVTVESPLRGDTHGGFGERPGETGRR